MKKITLLLAIAFIAPACDKEKPYEEPPRDRLNSDIIETDEVLYVAAKSGLNLRTEPKAKSKVVTLVPYGSLVRVLEDKAKPVPMTSEGYRGFWKKLLYRGKIGYAFSGFLLPRPAPKKGEDFKSYIYRIYGPKKGEKIHTAKESVNIENKKTWKEEYFLQDGARHLSTGYYSGERDTYDLPGLTLQEVYLMAKLTGLSFLKQDSFPVKNDQFNDTKDPMNSYTLKVKRSGDKVTEITADQDYFGFEMKSTSSGVTVISGGGT